MILLCQLLWSSHRFPYASPQRVSSSVGRVRQSSHNVSTAARSRDAGLDGELANRFLGVRSIDYGEESVPRRFRYWALGCSLATPTYSRRQDGHVSMAKTLSIYSEEGVRQRHKARCLLFYSPNWGWRGKWLHVAIVGLFGELVRRAVVGVRQCSATVYTGGGHEQPRGKLVPRFVNAATFRVCKDGAASLAF